MDSIQTPCIFRASKAGLPRASALGIDQELRLARPEKKTRRPYGALRAVFFLKGGSVPAQRDPQTETQDGRLVVERKWCAWAVPIVGKHSRAALCLTIVEIPQGGFEYDWELARIVDLVGETRPDGLGEIHVLVAAEGPRRARGGRVHAGPAAHVVFCGAKANHNERLKGAGVALGF